MASEPPSSSPEEQINPDAYVLGAYAKYLGSMLETFPEYISLHRSLEHWCTHQTSVHTDRGPAILVVDCQNGILKQRSFHPSGDGHPNRSLFAALQQYDDADDARIVLAEIDARANTVDSSARIMDALGWTYDIDPAFLHAVHLSFQLEDEDVDIICRHQRGHNS